MDEGTLPESVRDVKDFEPDPLAMDGTRVLTRGTRNFTCKFSEIIGAILDFTSRSPLQQRETFSCLGNDFQKMVA